VEDFINEIGVSDGIGLPPGGYYTLQVTSGNRFVVTLQVGDGTDWADMYYDSRNVVSMRRNAFGYVGPTSIQVPGGKYYRMNCGQYGGSLITMTAVAV